MMSLYSRLASGLPAVSAFTPSVVIIHFQKGLHFRNRQTLCRILAFINTDLKRILIISRPINNLLLPSVVKISKAKIRNRMVERSELESKRFVYQNGDN